MCVLDPVIPVVCVSSHCIIMAVCVLYMAIKGISILIVITVVHTGVLGFIMFFKYHVRLSTIAYTTHFFQGGIFIYKRLFLRLLASLETCLGFE